MTPAQTVSEAERLAVLQSYEILDTRCDAAFDNLAELAAMLTGSPIAAVSLVDAERQWFLARYGMDLEQTPREISFCAHAILDPSQPLIVSDARVDPRFAANPLVTGPFGLRFYAGVPLVTGERAVLGTLCVIDREPREVSPLERIALTRLADAVMTTLELRRALAQLHRCALSDSLTGLPNRTALLNAIGTMMAHQQRHGGAFSLLLIDLDGFKTVNDRFGHVSGDSLLRVVAERLRLTLRGEDFAARYGGDEFAILVAAGTEGAIAIAERFQENLAGAMTMLHCPVSCSIGIVSLDDPPPNAESVLREADTAMYRAKAAGKNRIECASPATLRRPAPPRPVPARP